MKPLRIPVLAFVLSAALLAACGGGSAPPSGGSSGRSASTTTTTAGSGPVTAATAPWSLPAATSRTVALADNGHLLVLGGLTTGDVSTSAISEIDPETGAVSGVGRLALAVHDAAGAVIGGRAFVFGGGAASTIATVQAWDPTSGGAALKTGTLPQPRSDLAAVTVGGTTYVVGGFDGSALPGEILATTDGINFRQVGTLAQAVRYPAVAADSQGRVWVFGGDLGASESASAGGQTSAVQRFNPADGSTLLVAHLPAPIGHASAFVLGSRMFLAGGRSGSTPASGVWQVNTSNGQVTPVGNLPGPRSDAGVVVLGSTAYLLGGEVSGPTQPLSSVVAIKA